MLKQRIITALWLLPLMLGMLFYAPNALWAAFSALIALLALAEYARISGIEKEQRRTYLATSAGFCLVAYAGGWQLPALVWCVVLAFWLVGVPLWLKNKWTLTQNRQRYALGWLLMMPFWFALVSQRPTQEAAVSLLAIMGLVWVADIAAYFCGKAFGKRKIAPAISPGKSWEGAIGGALCVALYMVCVNHAGWLAVDVGNTAAVIIGWLLTAVSICGDLLESWFKRTAGLKDSSNLLPGHGGVFDRTDSLIAVLSVYTAIMALTA
ncbi:phosphatidate cytidylyltransferase [Neisseria lisongii]|uniref:Phosphatidate cytidylyltransferase n=1 Tax=Neisseria lisongii TaxID=2912188 RepID=A0AAW5AP37_9NEIS|nr:phosphatidate cytidylyltransferase [Neisseria lisongii]MCF7529937.1 phosphatidate cytidylyltransferase [Neisseria lisongii]